MSRLKRFSQSLGPMMDLDEMYPGKVVKEGYLRKKGAQRRNWKERWFVLKGSHLLYFVRPLDTKPQGAIFLSDVVVGVSTRKAFCFAIYKGERTYLICASNQTEQQAWMAVIEKTISPELKQEDSSISSIRPLSNIFPQPNTSIQSRPFSQVVDKKAILQLLNNSNELENNTSSDKEEGNKDLLALLRQKKPRPVSCVVSKPVEIENIPNQNSDQQRVGEETTVNRPQLVPNLTNKQFKFRLDQHARLKQAIHELQEVENLLEDAQQVYEPILPDCFSAIDLLHRILRSLEAQRDKAEGKIPKYSFDARYWRNKNEQVLKCQKVARSYLLRKKFLTIVYQALKDPSLKQERQRWLALKEIISSEKRYVYSIQQLIQKFLEPLESISTKFKTNQLGVTKEHVDTIFSNIKEIHTCSCGLLTELIADFENLTSMPNIANVIIQTAPTLAAYETYINNFTAAQDTVNSLSTNVYFVHFIKSCENSTSLSLDFKTLLQLPLLRTSAYVLLLEDLLHRTDVTRNDHQSIVTALSVIRDVTKTFGK